MAPTNAARAVTLDLKGPLHVGQFVGVEREAALDWAPADTLFGALVSAWAALGRDVSALLAGFRAGDPPFLLTSAFPRAGEVRFYPRPWVRPQPPDVLQGKRAKRLRWVSEGVFQRLIAGEPLDGENQTDNFIQGDAVWLTQAERKELPDSVWEDGRDRAWSYQAAPRVTVDRAANASNLFHTGRVDFAPGCGLWFGLRFHDDDPAWPSHVESALHYLADAGLGGLRATGHGAFTWKWSPLSLIGRGAGGEGRAGCEGPLAVTLSRYAPRDATELQATLLNDQRAAYRLVTVGGWCMDDHRHPWRRRNVRLVMEGSLLAWDGQTAIGHVVDVTPQHVGAFGTHHRVWRYGYAFPVLVSTATAGGAGG